MMITTLRVDQRRGKHNNYKIKGGPHKQQRFDYMSTSCLKILPVRTETEIGILKDYQPIKMLTDLDHHISKYVQIV